MKLSVIILNYNVQYFLEQCITSVERALQGIDGEIIVIDNDSKDGSCDMVRTKFPHIQLIENKVNVGFSKANNQAVAEAQGEYVCILNPDTAVAEDTFTKSLNYAENTKELGALGIQLMDGTGNFLPESKRNVPTPTRALFKLIGKTKGHYGYYVERIPPHGSGEIDVLVGAFMLMKRSVYNEVGGFGEEYFMYGEDIDLSHKLQLAGYSNVYFGNLSMLHYKGESTKRDAVYIDRFYGAMRIFYRKHFRSNFVLNGIVHTGVLVAKLFRKVKEKKRRDYTFRTDKVIVFSEDLGLLKKVTESYEIPVSSGSKIQLESTEIRNSLLIFDVSYISYGQIFSVMQKLKNRENTFRIKPPGCSFVIGSDQSDQKGGVLKL